MQNFIDLVISTKNKSITDEVFLLIQNDRELMQEYLKLIRDHEIITVNQQIGKGVKDRYGLTNDNYRDDDPSSSLISSYQCFK